ncbi:MAG: 4-hydroxy-3-methylbut-2-enyl diphosphate reductase [Campylobacterota bacterium]|nr:4-hydroxy-3-methylbut-2-enyl diphosphate reductase [Campylobacterota bacterium]
MLKIELAESYGFCFGVKRAIKIAEYNQNSATYGELIHNSKEIARLKNDYNVNLVHDINDFNTGDKAVIRTHGIPKNELQILKDNSVNIVDATCPYVTKPQQICEEMSAEGYEVVIFGDATHPEIKGVKSYSSTPTYVVNNVEELSKIDLKEKIALVAQTTRKAQEYLKISNYLIPRHKEVRVFNTICNATFENQIAAKELAKKADIMIIIGGKNSSNTKQLFSIAKEICPSSYHIESQSDLQNEWFNEKKHCGISAGASTPAWIIEEVVKKIEFFTH